MNNINENNKEIYLYRHGETNWNVENRIMGQLKGIKTRFTNKGYSQIKEISKKIKENNVEVIYCSDFERTYETAIVANQSLRLPIIKSKEIRGLNMGKYQGLSFNEFITKKEVQNCFNNHNLKFDAGESINELNDRVLNFIIHISKTTKYNKIAIITHSAVISNLKSYLLREKYVSLKECTLLYTHNNLYVIDYISN